MTRAQNRLKSPINNLSSTEESEPGRISSGIRSRMSDLMTEEKKGYTILECEYIIAAVLRAMNEHGVQSPEYKKAMVEYIKMKKADE